MPLTLLSKDEYLSQGAFCLDGGGPGFYYRAANSSASSDPEASTSWVLYFKGGGWCYDEASCAARALSSLGSSSKFPKTFGFGGLLDPNPLANPVLAGYNHVILWYCDGASFSGNADKPYQYKDPKTGKIQDVFFRGRRVLDAVLAVLMKDYGLDKATQVLLSGGSAGGLSTYLHADYVQTKLPKSVKKFKAAPVSGFFMLHSSDPAGSQAGAAVYPDRMKYVFNMQNSSGGVNKDCTEAGHGWRCIFANYSYAYSSTPMFPFQSVLDSWQMGNIFYPFSSDRRSKCVAHQFGECTANEVEVLNKYASSVLADFRRTSKFSRPGEGGFVESCLEHVAAQGSVNFDKYSIGGITEVKAFNSWWDVETSISGSRLDKSTHWHLPCQLSAEAPHRCNPTCGQARDLTGSTHDSGGQLVFPNSCTSQMLQSFDDRCS